VILREIRIKNYKSLRDVTLTGLDGLLVLVGPNNAGKTCILEVLKQIPALNFGAFAAIADRVSDKVQSNTVEVGLQFDLDEPQRIGLLREVQPFGLPLGVEQTQFFRKLRITFMTRPDGTVFEGVFCPVNVKISDEDGSFMDVVDTDLGEAIRNGVRVRHQPHASRILNLGMLQGSWFQTLKSVRKPPLEPMALGQLPQQTKPSVFYYEPFKRYCSGVRFLDSQFIPPDSMALGGSLSLAPNSENLPTVFHTLHGGEEEKFDLLAEFASELIPDIKRVRAPVEGASTALEFEIGQLRLRLSQVGSGIGRALAVAYQALMTPPGGLCVIEEPESHLHPAAQRTLLSFLTLQAKEKQIALSTHSPAVAGSVERNQVFLVVNEEGRTKVLEGREPETAFKIARALGVNPSDQITTDALVVFVDSPADEKVLRAFAQVLWREGKLTADFNEAPVSILPLYGEGNLNFLVNSQNLANLGRSFCWIVDSDKGSASEELSTQKRGSIEGAKAMGGHVFVWRKRELENYLHPSAIARVLRIETPVIDDYSDAKEAVTALLQKEKSRDARFVEDKHGPRIAQNMTADEIMQRSQYREDDRDRFEIIELFEAILTRLSGGQEIGKEAPGRDVASKSRAAAI
jgi:ABC-type cobalamin/Fe3+-siderophores transport system ATPase subunit